MLERLKFFLLGGKAAVISLAHKRTEGRAPVWGSELTSKAAAIQGGSSRNRCWAERKIVDFGGGAFLPGRELPLKKTVLGTRL